MQLYYTRGGQTGKVKSTVTRVTKARLIHNQGQCIGRCRRQTERISKRQAGSKGQAANGQKSINSPGSQQETHTQGKRSEILAVAKQYSAMRKRKSKAYKACLMEFSCVISAMCDW